MITCMPIRMCAMVTTNSSIMIATSGLPRICTVAGMTAAEQRDHDRDEATVSGHARDRGDALVPEGCVPPRAEPASDAPRSDVHAL